MKIKNIVITGLCIILFGSCHRTRLNKYIIESADAEVYSLAYNADGIYKAEKCIDNSKKTDQYLLLIKLHKKFVPDGNGTYPFEGVHGNMDSIINSNIPFDNEINLCADLSVTTSNLNFANGDASGTYVCVNEKYNLDSLKAYYNSGPGNNYSYQELYVPVLATYAEVIDMEYGKMYIKTRFRNNVRKIVIKSSI